MKNLKKLLLLILVELLKNYNIVKQIIKECNNDEIISEFIVINY